MDRTKGNLSLLVVTEEVDNVLEIYAHHPDLEALFTSQFRQELIDYVISKIKKVYLAQKERSNQLFLPKLPYYSLELRLGIEKYIYEGIERILKTNSDLLPA